MIADLDRFKSVNDTWGHDFGDEVLRAVSAAAAGSVRATDMVARLGGEEFGIVLPATAVEGAEVVAERVLEAVRGIRLETPDGAPRRHTVSLGLAVLVGPCERQLGADGIAARLYKAADAALYTAKMRGRDRVSVAPRPVSWTLPVAKAA